jgi:ring-1,2-phenylacetyl-CoA epoxidase subunit PaaE
MRDYQPLRIAAVRREAAEAISVMLEVPPDLAAAFRFKPGQHLPVRATIGGAEQRRTYSICCGPGEAGLRIAIKRVNGGLFSNWANETLRAGGTLDVMPPAGRFVLPEGGSGPRHLAALAAGAGITPIIAIAKHALALEPRSSFTLVYGNRSPGTILFREELEGLKDCHLDRFTLLHTLSHNEESGAPLFEGRITGDKVKSLAQTLLKPEATAHVFLCGPGSMIKDTRRALLESGFQRAQVHHEFFAPTGGAPSPRLRTGSGPSPPSAISGHDVGREGSDLVTEAIAVLDGVRHRFQVPPGGRVVDAALAAGIRVPYSCKAGMCCTCRARLIEGKAEMATNYSLEPWEIERGFILTCQAVPGSGRLVVDYDQM